MIPLKWKTRRPGLMIPVFFLCLFPTDGQEPLAGVKAMALAGCFVSRTGNPGSMENQAGLADEPVTELSLLHRQPFLVRDLGISSLACCFPIPHGGMGMTVSTLGIHGMRYYSAWIGCGLRLGSNLSAGMGIHLLDFATAEYGHHPGAGCSLGFQYRAGDRLLVGGHICNPVSAAPGIDSRNSLPMILSTGIAYTFFKTATWYTELQASPHGPVAWANGIEAVVPPSVILMAGIRTQPLTLSAGVSLPWNRWKFTSAVAWCFDTGITPGFALGYRWDHE
jgi:hypothetical protein